MPVPALRIRLAPIGLDNVRWQLVARNGRALGMSVSGYSGVDAALTALAEMHVAIPDLSPNFSHPRSSVMWEWTALDRAGLAVAWGGRSYDRYGTCVAAYRRFVAMAAKFPPPYRLDR